MSRQELAEAVNAHVYRATGRVSAMDAHYIGRLERGVRRYPSVGYRTAFRAVLDAAADAELGFQPAWRLCTDAPNPSPAATTAAMAPAPHLNTPMHLVVPPGMAVVLVAADHPILLAFVDERRSATS